MTVCRINHDGTGDLSIKITNGIIEQHLTTNEFELIDGWQLLTVSSDKFTSIQNVLINGEDIKVMMFSSWGIRNGEYIQPCLQCGPDVVWHIWLNSNHATLMERYTYQLRHNLWGTDLRKDKHIYFNFAKEIDQCYGNHMVQYFGTCDGPNYHPKNYKQNPYTVLDLEYNSDEFYTDITDYPFSWLKNPNMQWKSERIRDPNDKMKPCDVDTMPFPNIQHWLKANGINHIKQMLINLVKPNETIDMHIVDDNVDPECQVMYVPLYPSDKSIIKVSGGGFMPTGKVCLLNNRHFPHGSIAGPERDRYVLLFITKFDEEWVEHHRVPPDFNFS